MGETRSRSATTRKLTPDTPAEELRSLYWLKSELDAFCRTHRLSSAGGKIAVTDRIEHFLRTGERTKPSERAAVERLEARPRARPPESTFTMATRAPAGLRCTQRLRAFFELHLGRRFRFTVPLQAFIKANPGVTFGRVAQEWQRLDALQRAGEWRPTIGPQFEFNQFMRDYHADPKNEGKTHGDCLRAWRRIRERRGDRRYRPEDA